MRRLALVPILVSAFLFPSAAAALGLGEIELQSALNQRLDAEIPLRGVPADRADDVIVTLASEQAFQDVGLQRPFALTKLRFQVKQRPDGDYYVHLTSDEAIVEPFLSFLVEVDWPGGNLLREYTVLLDPPVFTTEKADEGDDAGAPEAAGDEVAAEGVPGEIERAEEDDEAAQRSASATAPADDAPADEDETATVEAEAPAAGDEPAATAAAAGTEPAAETAAAEDTRTREGDFGDTPLFLEVEREEEEAEQRLAERRAAERDRSEQEAQTRAYEEGVGDDAGTGAAAAGPDVPSEYGPVREGETLWNIASRLKGGDMTIQQMMLALLRYNPEAFADDNINRLRQGYVLRVPDASEVRSVSAQQAVARVGEQNALWQEWRRAQGADGTRRAAREEDDAPAIAEAETGADAASAEGDEARLSIVGSDEGGAASDEQASATSASDRSTSEELKLARERLESAEMEKAELQSRVDELEQTVDKMERLITLREERLSELQQQLEELRRQREEAAAEAEAEAAPADEAAAEEDAAAADETADDDTSAAAAGDGGTGNGGTGASGTSGDTGGGAADDAGAADEGTTAGDETAADTGDAAADASATADAGETATAEDGGADAAATDATAAEDDSGVVTTRTEPAEKGWLDTLSGMASSVAATVTGMVAGLAGGAGGGLFAGPTSPGFLGAAGLLVLALVLVLVRRRRAAAEPAAADTEAESFEAIAGEADDWTAEEEADVASMERGSEVMAEELAGADEDDSGRAAAPDLAEQHFDFGALGETGGDQGGEDEDAPKDDTVAEADVYLAYGLHQQAEDLLRLALKESPQRADYHEKLLETLYGAGKRDEFVAVARDFRNLAETPQGRPWQRVVAMGKEIAPDEAMFGDAADPGIRPDELHQRKPETTDIELDPGSESHVDFGLDDAAAPADAAHSETQMLETGTFEAASDAASPGAHEPVAAEADARGDLEFDLGELGELGGAQSQAGAPTAAPETDEDDPEATAGPGGGDDDALEFDLGDLDLGEPQPETPDPDATVAAAGADAGDEEIEPEATVAATGDPDFSLDFDDTRTPAADTGAPAGSESGGLDATGASAEAGAGGDDDALDLGDIDLGDSGHEDTAEQTAAAGGADAALELGDPGRGEASPDSGEETAVGGGAADDALDLDAPDRDEDTAVGGGADDDGAFDLSDLDAEFADMAGEGGGSDEDTAGGGDDEIQFDFDVSGLDDEAPAGEDTADSAGDDGPDATATVAGGAAAGAAGEDDEFDTMLDLAKAYIDMGDAESASNALEEVIQSGNEAQQREARGLLETVQ